VAKTQTFLRLYGKKDLPDTHVCPVDEGIVQRNTGATA